MRGLKTSVLFPLLLLFSCARNEPLPEAPAELLSVVDVADPAAVLQLTHGFSMLEDGRWRWTKREFRVVLQPPEGANSNGARLELTFDFPRAVLERLGPIRLGAEVNGLRLPPESFAESGRQAYTREVPAVALSEGAVAVDFTTDKALPPDPEGDDRELALIAFRIALLPR
jgi:hypothetical protein